MIDYTDKCGTCVFFLKKNIPRTRAKGVCLKHRSTFSGVNMGRPKCSKYKVKEGNK